ncbi:hypothetical protein KBX31_02695 [Liquorilactobacillus satsumensis]|uniref:hypothetical protein n=1 Tax=Liquorilactobacillus satsumensis TaxID=259059 RepID=UPI0021C366FB|nr:hypothetical protein [Liquorilactobacillus satsumensis]MCP9312208.1 hypothetical protein [Liquorilactobacillus satsumensis]MCP9359487.1 hypothetical protein [Liquorilactobacillus satsumensis]
MDNTVIEKTEARAEKNTEWRLSNSENGHFLNVVFGKDVEEAMKRQRNFSFNRFESEQLNNLRALVPELDHDYELVLDENAIGSDYMPLAADDAKQLLKVIVD